MYKLQCTMYNVQINNGTKISDKLECKMYNVQVQRTMYNVQISNGTKIPNELECKMYNVQCTMYKLITNQLQYKYFR